MDSSFLSYRVRLLVEDSGHSKNYRSRRAYLDIRVIRGSAASSSPLLVSIRVHSWLNLRG